MSTTGRLLAWATLVMGGLTTGAAESAAPATLVVHLEYREVARSLDSWDLPFVAETLTFRREPDFGGRKVVRRSLRLAETTEPAFPFAWDKEKGRLYLDLNGNLDLTDDPDGVRTSAGRGDCQTFAGVRLPLRTSTSTRTILVDLSLAESRGGVTCLAALRSYWAGKLILDGREWQVGLVDNYVGNHLGAPHVLLRPWERRDAPLNLTDGSLDAVDFSSRLFWLGRAFEVSWSFSGAGTATRHILEMRATNVPLAEVKLTGAFVDRLVLRGRLTTAVLEQPAAVARVPIDSYTTIRVRLRRGEAVAYREVVPYRDADRVPEPGLIVSTTNVAVLQVGGPLTNSVTVAQRGRTLVLSYRLLGADGLAYRIGTVDRQTPPEFTAFRGDRKVASGKFYFG